MMVKVRASLALGPDVLGLYHIVIIDACNQASTWVFDFPMISPMASKKATTSWATGTGSDA